MNQPRGLGRGIRALIPEGNLTLPDGKPESKQGKVIQLPLQSIRPSRFQPRQDLDELKIQKLADSIRESGLIYPLLVRKIDGNGVDNPQYELIAGERRLRALRLLGESEAPVIVKDVQERQALELSLIENIQRQELNPVEEALAYRRLSEQFGLSQEQISLAVGKERSTVANTLRLLKLASFVQEELRHGTLESGHARALLALESERSQVQLAKKIVAEGLSVRRVEQIVKMLTNPSRTPRIRTASDPHLAAVEQRLQKTLGTNVQIQHGRSRGWIRMAYYSLKDLDRLVARMLRE